MRSFLCLVLIGVVSCTSLLKNLPPNADVKYIYKNNKLVGVDIDYNNDLRPIVKSAALPVPTVKKVVSIASPVAHLPAVKKAGATKTYYKVDDGQLEKVKPTHVGYSVLPEAHAAPVVKSVPVPAVPVAPVPVAKTYYKVDDGQLEKVKPTHVGYSVLPEAPATPIVKSVPAPAPVAAVEAPKPLRITGPKVVLKQAPAPTARSVIITGPQVIYKRIGPVPVASPVPVDTPLPVVMVKSAPATPAPASPLIKTFWKQDDGELEKISPTHVSYSAVKSAPALVPVVPVAAPAPVVYSLPTPESLTVEQESLEEEDDD